MINPAAGQSTKQKPLIPFWYRGAFNFRLGAAFGWGSPQSHAATVPLRR